jgi:hypothetical protein
MSVKLSCFTVVLLPSRAYACLERVEAGRVRRQHNRRSYYVSFLVNHGKFHNSGGDIQQTNIAIPGL